MAATLVGMASNLLGPPSKNVLKPRVDFEHQEDCPCQIAFLQSNGYAFVQ